MTMAMSPTALSPMEFMMLTFMVTINSNKTKTND